MNIPKIKPQWLVAVWLLASIMNPLAGQEASPTTPLPQSRAEQLALDANRMVDAGDYSQAAEAYAELVKLLPTNGALRFRLANTQLMAAQPKESVENFEKLVDMVPEQQAQLWQLGIAHYYAGQFEAGKKLFELHQTVNSSDVENSVWHLMCHAQIAGLKQAREKKIVIQNDRRIPMNEIYQMFMGNAKPADVLQAAQKPATATSLNMQKYYAHLYIGLFQHLSGDETAARTSMKRANQFKPKIRGRLMFEIPAIHLAMFPEPKNDSK